LASALKAVYGVLFLVEPTLSFLIATHEFGVDAKNNNNIYQLLTCPTPIRYAVRRHSSHSP
jgi:hypothetical protein